MQITLNQDEIHDALKDYVRQRISIKDNQNIEIDLKNGRGENGTTATINITSPNAKNVHSISSPTEEQEDTAQDVTDENEDEAEDFDEPTPALFN
jgi:hypothetical protein